MYSYNVALGEYDTDGFVNQDDEHLLFFLWFLNTMMISIIMLNLLIAIMGDTFGRVQETFENNMYKELASIMEENENLINRKRIFGDAKYIIIIQEERAEESHESWEGSLKYLKKSMDKAVFDQNRTLATFEKGMQNEIKEKAEKRGKEMETSANRYINVMLERIEGLQTLIDEKTAEYTPSDKEGEKKTK